MTQEQRERWLDAQIKGIEDHLTSIGTYYKVNRQEYINSLGNFWNQMLGEAK
jgi:hypothetical protein